MENSPGPDLTTLLEQFERCQARNRDLEARNRDLEAQLQAQRQEVAEQEQRLTRQAAQHAEQIKQMGRQAAPLQQALAEAAEEVRRRDDEAGEGPMESTREELQSLRRRMRCYEHEAREQVLLLVARLLLETWDAKTQRGMLLTTKATYAELLPLVTRAVLVTKRPCSFAGANGLRELTLDLDTSHYVPPHVRSDIAKWSHLTGLRVLTLASNRALFELPASISNLASLSELHIDRVRLAGLRHLSALTQLASLHVICGQLEFGKVPVLPSLQVLHMDDDFLTGMQGVARQANLTELHVCSRRDANDDPLDSFEPVAGLTRLQELALRNCLGTASLEPLAALTKLTHLDLKGAGATSLQPLTALMQLRVLNLSQARHVQSLGPVARLSALEHLDISYCADYEEFDFVAALDVAPLTALTGLKTINIGGCVMRNVELLAGMQQLTVRRRR